jgi:hypothetical protein
LFRHFCQIIGAYTDNWFENRNFKLCAELLENVDSQQSKDGLADASDFPLGVTVKVGSQA